MTKQQNQPGFGPEGPPGITPDQMHSMVHLGRMMGDVRDDFDREVEHHLATDYPHEQSYKKMQAARTGGLTVQLGPSEFEQQQQKQAQA
jgi:hypothetical protein